MKAAIHKNKSLGFPVVVWVVALAVTLTASWAAAQTETTLPAVQSGLIGIARAQTARLNVVHLMPLDPDYPPSPCMATLMFLNEQGEIFLDRAGNPVATRVEIFPGDSAFLELRATDALAGSTAMRRPFRGVVERAAGSVEYPPNPCDGIVSTLEVYDSFTGRTTILHELRAGPPLPPAAGE